MKKKAPFKLFACLLAMILVITSLPMAGLAEETKVKLTDMQYDSISGGSVSVTDDIVITLEADKTIIHYDITGMSAVKLETQIKASAETELSVYIDSNTKTVDVIDETDRDHNVTFDLSGGCDLAIELCGTPGQTVSFQFAEITVDPTADAVAYGKVEPDKLIASDVVGSYTTGAVDETVLNVGSKIFYSGLSMMAGVDNKASATYSVKDMNAKWFRAYVGPDSVANGTTGSAIFEVYADGNKIAGTQEAVNSGEYVYINAPIPSGAKSVTLTAVAQTSGMKQLNFANAGFYYEASADNTGVVYLSDINYSYQRSLGGVIRDANNAGNGKITIEGQSFDKGVSIHPMLDQMAVINYDIFNLGAKTFSAYVGQCDTANAGGDGVDIKIYLDEKLAYSNTFQYNTPADHVVLDLEGVSSMYFMFDLRGTPSSDAFSLGDAKFTLDSEETGQFLTYGRIDLTEYDWKDAVSNGAEPRKNKSQQDERLITVAGQEFKKGISLHPLPAAVGYIEYDISSLNGDIFTVKVGKTLETSWSNPSPQYKVKFRVYGDGVMLAETPEVIFGEYYTISVNVEGVTTLRLELDNCGDYSCDSSAFCEPALYYSAGKGDVHITSPYIKDTESVENFKEVTITGNAPSVDELKLAINGYTTDADFIRNNKGDFSVTIGDFENSNNEITVMGYVQGVKTSEDTIKFQIIGGNVISLYKMGYSSVGTNGNFYDGVGPYYQNTLTIGGGAMTTQNGFCVQPQNGAAGSAGSFDVVYDVSLMSDYRYFSVTVGRDDRAPITGGANRGTAKCYILSDAPGLSSPIIATTKKILTAGTYEVLSCEIPEGTTKLTLRTSNYDNANYSDYIDWFDPTVAKSKDIFYATEETAYDASAKVTAEPKYSFAARFNTEAPFNAVAFKAVSDNESGEITAKLYSFLYSRTRSSQEAAVAEDVIKPDAQGVYVLDCIKQYDAGEYVLILEGVKEINYSDSKKGAVYIDGECKDGFAELSVRFTSRSDNYFAAASQEGEVITSSVTTEAEKQRARAQFEGYLDDLSTFPSSLKIGDTLYEGFGTDFTVKSTETDSDELREITVITMEHTSGLLFELTAVFYPEYAAFDWVIYFSNPTDHNSPVVTQFNVADMDFTGEDPYFMTSFGETPYITPYLPLNKHLEEGDYYFYDANTGRSSEEDSFPYFNLEYGDMGAFVAVGWPGWWETELTYNDGTLNMVASQSALNSYLKPGETFRTPLMAFILYDGRDLSRATNLWRHWFIDCNMYTEDNGLLEPGIGASTGWVHHEMLNATESALIDFIETYEYYGIDLDYFWMDAGWYNLPDYAWSDGSPWLYSGDWSVDTERFPTKLKAVADCADKYDIDTILWFEPERVGMYIEDLEKLSAEKDSVVKPEWLVAIDENYEMVNGGSPFNVLDLSNPECVDWLIETVTEILVEARITIYREDFNVATTPAWGTQDGVGNGILDRSGSTENLHIQGHLRYWDALLELDNIEMIDTCASGGHRLDLETMRRAVALHPADYDYSDMVAKQVMTYTIGQWIPYFGTNTGGDTSNTSEYALRSCYHPYVSLMYNVVNASFGKDDIAQLQESVAEFNTIKQYYYDDLYQLTDWNISPDRWYSYEYLNPESGSGYAMVYRRDGAGAPSQQYIHLKGLDENAIYVVSLNDAGTSVVVSGKEAMEKGVSVTLANANSSEVVRISLFSYETVSDLIGAIGEVTVNSGDAINAARQAYDQLSEDEKKSVSNYDILTAAEKAYKELCDAAAAAEVDEKINKLEKGDSEAIQAARAAYEALSDEQKALVTALDKLTGLEVALKGIYGDINDDGVIMAADALLALQGAVGKIQLTDRQQRLANVNNDDSITAADALLILQHAVGKIKIFPIEQQ